MYFDGAQSGSATEDSSVRFHREIQRSILRNCMVSCSWCGQRRGIALVFFCVYLLLYFSGIFVRVSREKSPLASRSTRWKISDRLEKFTKHRHKFRILYWNKFYGNADFYVGFGKKPFIGCEYTNCETTARKELANSSDAIVFHMLNKWQIPLPARRSNQRYIFFLKEPPPLSKIKLQQHIHMFNWTMTYRFDSDVPSPYFSALAGHTEPTPLPDINLRSKAVAWIVSKCLTSSGRETYVEQLEKHIDVHIFGGCGESRCPRGERWKCYQEAAKHFHFYLSFENSRCRDYITEKFSQALKYGMVPVALGANRSTYELYAPPHSFIHIDDFASPRLLANYLHRLIANKTAFAEYFTWRRNWRIVSGGGWCNLCRHLNTVRSNSVRRLPLDRWWFSGCRTSPVAVSHK